MAYSEDFAEFADRAAEAIAAVKAQPTLEDEPGQDNLLFMTAIPWVSFTSFKHPMPLQPTDSIPRFARGKILQGGRENQNATGRTGPPRFDGRPACRQILHSRAGITGSSRIPG